MHARARVRLLGNTGRARRAIGAAASDPFRISTALLRVNEPRLCHLPAAQRHSRQARKQFDGVITINFREFLRTEAKISDAIHRFRAVIEWKVCTEHDLARRDKIC